MSAVCATCHGEGTVEKPISRDEFGNWDTEEVCCSDCDMKPRLLDLFCGAGGAAMGYHRAGFDVVGVDIKPQPNYPFEFVQGDAMALLRNVADGLGDWRCECGDLNRGHETFCYRCGAGQPENPAPLVDDFDAIHASPPCQAFTSLNGMWNAKEHSDLLTPTRELLQRLGVPYVIENVVGAPMNGSHVTLCGSAFGLGTEGAELRRHRHFETNFAVMVPPCQHGRKERVIGVYGGHGRDRRRASNGQDFPTSARREAMGIDWMTGTELSQAIPPAYTEHIGSYLIAEVTRRSEVAA